MTRKLKVYTSGSDIIDPRIRFALGLPKHFNTANVYTVATSKRAASSRLGETRGVSWVSPTDLTEASGHEVTALADAGLFTSERIIVTRDIAGRGATKDHRVLNIDVDGTITYLGSLFDDEDGIEFCSIEGASTDYVERESWFGKLVILAWERDEFAQGMHPDWTSVPRYRVIGMDHGNGKVFIGAVSDWARIRTRYEHVSSLIEITEDGTEVRGFYSDATHHGDRCDGTPYITVDRSGQFSAECSACSYELTGCETRREAGARFYGGDDPTLYGNPDLQAELIAHGQKVYAELIDIERRRVEGGVGAFEERVHTRLAAEYKLITSFVTLPTLEPTNE